MNLNFTTVSKIAFAILTGLTSTAFAQTPEKLVDIKDNTQTSRMSVHKNGALLVGGTYTGTSIGMAAEGAGTRLIWHPEKGAFRVGVVQGVQWDDSRIGNYSIAAGLNVIASGNNSSAFGLGSTASAQASFAAGENTAATGAASVALGYRANTNSRQGSFVFSDRSSVDTLRAGLNHSANWRVSGGFRIFTASNLSTGLTFQSGASESNWGQANAVISTSTGAYLSTSGVWTNTSDVNKKHLFESMNEEEVLAKLVKLKVQKWSYKVDAVKIKHVGPTAQDFYAAFGLGADEKTIGTVDADGIALIGVKALNTKSAKQATEIEQLRNENSELKKRLDALENKNNINTASFPWAISAFLAVILFAGLAYRRRSSLQTKN